MDPVLLSVPCVLELVDLSDIEADAWFDSDVVAVADVSSVAVDDAPVGMMTVSSAIIQKPVVRSASCARVATVLHRAAVDGSCSMSAVVAGSSVTTAAVVTGSLRNNVQRQSSSPPPPSVTQLLSHACASAIMFEYRVATPRPGSTRRLFFSRPVAAVRES